MIQKIIRNMSTPSRIPLINKPSNYYVDLNVSSYSYMYHALIKSKNSAEIFNKNKKEKLILSKQKSLNDNDNDNDH